ncbi:MAG: glycosyltransferase family 2 protein [Acetobacteraceae bacterium]
MRVSVIIPTYNRADLLPATLASIRAQTLAPAEIIVVDDGSTDATPALLAASPDLRAIRVPNGGDLVARNIGLAAATAPYVAFCDSDDLWRPEFLAAMARLFDAVPGLPAAYGDFVLVQDQRWTTAGKFAAAPPGFWDGLRRLGPEQAVFDQPIVDRLIAFQPLFVSCLLARTEWLRGIGGWDASVGRRLAGDFATALRLAQHAPLGFLMTPLVGIRKHAANISGNDVATALGEAEVLAHVLATRPELAPLAGRIGASIRRRREAALAGAFVARDFAAVARIAELLEPGPRRLSGRAKQFVATLPPAPRAVLVRLLLAAGTFRGRMHFSLPSEI